MTVNQQYCQNHYKFTNKGIIIKVRIINVWNSKLLKHKMFDFMMTKNILKNGGNNTDNKY